MAETLSAFVLPVAQKWGKRGLRLRAVARSSRQDSQPLTLTLSCCESLQWVLELTFGSGEPRVVIGHKRALVEVSFKACRWGPIAEADT